MRYLAAIVGCGALMLGARLNPAPPVDMGRPVALDSIRMITPLVGWATTAGAIVRTVDGGRDWTPLPLPGHAAVGSAAPQFLDTRTAWVAADHPDGTMTLQVTYDGGRAWLFGGLVIGAAFPHQLIFLDARHGWLFVGGGGMHSNGLALYRTVDGGRSWTLIHPRLRRTETPTPTPSSSCGPWSAPTGAVGRPITARYGEIRGCLRVGRRWVLTTLGRAGQFGVIALYLCRTGDTPCLDGRTPHPFAHWRFYPPPHRGGVTVLAHSSPDVLIIDNAGYQLCFNLSAHRYETNPRCR